MTTAAEVAKASEGPGGQAGRLPRGVRVWYAVSAGVFWWAAHIVTFAAMARERCLHPELDWVLHAVTLVTALGTLLAMYWSYELLREGRVADDGSGDSRGVRHFLGLLGLLTGAINLLLILWEASYVFFLRAC